MKVNFEIKDNHALTFSGRFIDLHNNFDFVGLITILQKEK